MSDDDIGCMVSMLFVVVVALVIGLAVSIGQSSAQTPEQIYQAEGYKADFTAFFEVRCPSSEAEILATKPFIQSTLSHMEEEANIKMAEIERLEKQVASMSFDGQVAIDERTRVFEEILRLKKDFNDFNCKFTKAKELAKLAKCN